MAVGSFFFYAAPTAQTSPELYFRFMNSFIQSSLLESLGIAKCNFTVIRIQLTEKIQTKVLVPFYLKTKNFQCWWTLGGKFWPGQSLFQPYLVFAATFLGMAISVVEFSKKELKNRNIFCQGAFKYYVIMILNFFDPPTHLIIRRHHFLYPP